MRVWLKYTGTDTETVNCHTKRTDCATKATPGRFAAQKAPPSLSDGTPCSHFEKRRLVKIYWKSYRKLNTPQLRLTESGQRVTQLQPLTLWRFSFCSVVAALPTASYYLRLDGLIDTHWYMPIPAAIKCIGANYRRVSGDNFRPQVDMAIIQLLQTLFS